MTTFPGSPRLLRGGLVLVDPSTAALKRVVALQYNPETLSRSLQIKGVGEGGDRSEALRLLGPPVETYTLEAAIDATDQLEISDAQVRATGLHAQLAALETLVYPTRAQLLANDSQARGGTLEIAPMETPLALFVWSASRVVPVRVTDFSITEEAFDPDLNPIRAKVNLTLRVLSVDDLGFDHKGGGLYLIYQQQKEKLASMASPGFLDQLGLGGIP